MQLQVTINYPIGYAESQDLINEVSYQFLHQLIDITETTLLNHLNESMANLIYLEHFMRPLTEPLVQIILLTVYGLSIELSADTYVITVNTRDHTPLLPILSHF